MFQNKNTQNDSEKKDFSYTATPLHLMKDDLEAIKNPQQNVPVKKIESIPVSTPDNLSAKQKSSPFLASLPQENPINKPKESIPISSPVPLKEATKEEPEMTTSVPIKKAGLLPLLQEKAKKLPPLLPTKTGSTDPILGKVVFVFAMFFLLLIIGAGGYYFWIAKDNKPAAEKPQDQAIASPKEVIKNEPEPEIKKIFSLTGANDLQIDITAVDRVALAKQLDEQIEKVKAENPAGPIEFILTDLDKNPVKFKVFAEKLGLSLPKQINDLLSENFSLFVHNDNNNYRLGLSVDSSNDTKLSAAMLKEESKLVADLAPLLKNPENKEFLTKTYASTTYKETTIRYENIVSPDYLSMDYAIFKGKLIVGTTKNSIRSIIDLIEEKAKNSSSNEKTPTAKDSAPLKTVETPSIETTTGTQNEVKVEDNTSSAL